MLFYRQNLPKPEDYKPAIKSYRGSMPVADGWCTEDDVKGYQKLVSKVRNGHIVEVGSYEGLSLSHIKDICQQNNTKLYSVDFIAWPKLIENTQKWGIKFINLHSVEAPNKFADGFFDLVYIDGNHKKKQVIYDIWAWLPKLKKEGMLAGHDFYLNKIKNALLYVFGDLELFEVIGDVWSIENPHSKVVNLETVEIVD